MTLNTYKVRLVNEMIGHERDTIVVVHAETDEDALDACFHFDEYANATIIEENYAPEPDEPEETNMKSFEEWRGEVVDGYNDREGIIRSKTVWSEEDSYCKIVELRLALKDAYEAGWDASFRYMGWS